MHRIPLVVLICAIAATAAFASAPTATAHEYVCDPIHGCQEVSNVVGECWTYIGYPNEGWILICEI